MSGYPRLQATPRTVHGKKVRQLRRMGSLPGVIYGPAIDTPRPISVDAHDFELLYRTTGNTALVEVLVDGQSHTVFIRSVQQDPVKKQPLNVELYAPHLNQPIQANVPVVPVGELPGTVDGVLVHNRQDVQVQALPADIPQQIDVDVSGLTDIDSAILVSELPVPPRVEILTPPDEIVLKVEAPQRTAQVLEVPGEEALAEESQTLPSAVDEGAEPAEEQG